MLEINDLRVSYGGVEAVRGLSLKVASGTLVTLIGSNGAGKSSTLRAISGLAQISSGTVTMNGADLTNMRPDRIVRQGLVHCPEGRHVFPGLTVEENLRIGGHVRRATAGPRMDEVMDIFPKLRDRRRQLAQSLSGGEQQMVAIGRAIMAEPTMLLLDEPSLGLAPLAIEAVFESLRVIREHGATVLLVEQNAHLALDISDYAYVIERGSLRLEGPSSEVADSEEVRKSYLGI